jgi:hypothetical protein
MPKTLSRLLRSGQQISQTSKPRKPGKESDITRKRKKGPIEEVNDASVIKGAEREQPLFKRQKGESLKAYLDRIDVESNARIMEAYRRSRRQSDRRKRCVSIR